MTCRKRKVIQMGKILLIVEGERTEKRLLNHFYQLYGIENIEIVPFKTNIYSFYNRLKKDFAHAKLSANKLDLDLIDLPLFLNSYLRLKGDKRLNEMDFIETILVFDFDPQDPGFSAQVLFDLMRHFSNSTEHGKLYLNYPMVESFKDLKTLEYGDFFDSTVKLAVLKEKIGSVNRYKREVDDHTCLKSMNDIDLSVGNALLGLHGQKMEHILSTGPADCEDRYFQLCTAQASKLKTEKQLWVINTCILHLYDEYGPLIKN